MVGELKQALQRLRVLVEQKTGWAFGIYQIPPHDRDGHRTDVELIVRGRSFYLTRYREASARPLSSLYTLVTGRKP